MRRRLILAGAVLLFVLATAFVHLIREARHAAILSNAYGRMYNLRCALSIYEELHQTLPARFLRDNDGQPTLSWVAAVLPHVEEQAVFDQLDLNQGWNKPVNAEALRLGKDFWGWYDRDDYFSCALQSEASIWNPEAGLPRGSLQEFISLSREGVHPLQPYAIDEQSLREAIESGQEVLFITCGGSYGPVGIEHGKLTYVPKVRR